jgi:primosomal protein N' (replication factor Y)
LAKLGTGTERSEEALSEYFPRTKILRIDRDSMQKKSAFTAAIAQVLAGEPTIISGTQMIAKGHHFPKVSLAVILDADSGFFSADFRGSERIGQLLTQVAGRAGREQAGKVIIQTHYPDHPLLTDLLQKGYASFARQLLDTRQKNNLPPYSHGALIKSQSISINEAESVLTMVKQQVAHLLNKDDLLIGPLPALMPKRNNRFRFQLLLQCPSRKQRHHIVNTIRFLLSNNKDARKVRWAIDVDPQDMS